MPSRDPGRRAGVEDLARQRGLSATPRSGFVDYALSALDALSAAGEIAFTRGQPHSMRLRGRLREDSIALRPSAPGSEPWLARLLDALVSVAIPMQGADAFPEARWRIADRLGDLSGSWRSAQPPDSDHVFCFRLPETTALASLADYGARMLAVLLDMFELEGDQGPTWPVHVRMGGDLAEVPRIGPGELPALGPREETLINGLSLQPLLGVAASEPAIVALGRHWALTADLLCVRTSRSPDARLDAMRLACTRDWVVENSGHPSEVYEYLARVCNVSCKFCYLYGNPSQLATARGVRVASRGELDTRLRYYDPARRRGLFSAQWEINEFLVDPKLADVTRSLRRKTDEPFYFVTNGNPLTPDRIDLLEEVGPVHLIVSTNSVDATVRSRIMGEGQGQTRTALDSLEELVRRRIPFGVSLVALPEVPLDKLGDTVLAVDGVGPAFIRINLPGFTRDHPMRIDFDTDRYWREVVTWAVGMRAQVRTPLLVIPSAFEENFFHDEPNAPRIIGAVPGSPGAAAGLLPGDRVFSVGHLPVSTRAQLRSLLQVLQVPTDLELERGGRRLRVRIDPTRPPRYPYVGPVISKYVFPQGVVVAGSISTADIAHIEGMFADGGVDRAWVITSPVMLPAARDLVRRAAPRAEAGLHFVPVDCNYLGGNIRVLDMSTAGDIAEAVARELRGAPRPDVLLVPASGFNHRGRDLVGRHWQDLERWFEIPIRLLGATERFAF